MATSAVYLVKKPPDIVEVSDRFTQFHRNRFNSRRLAFWVDKGNAEVSVQSNAKTEKILVVSTCQMLVLLLFNQRTPWTFKDILKATRIPRNDFGCGCAEYDAPEGEGNAQSSQYQGVARR